MKLQSFKNNQENILVLPSGRDMCAAEVYANGFSLNQQDTMPGGAAFPAYDTVKNICLKHEVDAKKSGGNGARTAWRSTYLAGKQVIKQRMCHEVVKNRQLTIRFLSKQMLRHLFKTSKNKRTKSCFFIKNITLLMLSVFVLPAAFATTFLINQDSDLVGSIFSVTIKQGDTLKSLSYQYRVNLEKIKKLNPKLSPRRLPIGKKVLIPQEFILPAKSLRKGIVINIPELRLYYFTKDGKEVLTFPVALGREGWRTPTSSTKVIRKKANPSWHVPYSIKRYVYEKRGVRLPDVVPPGANNPLGKYAIYLGLRSYLIHGTNRPSSIGKFMSSGCVRMFNDDIEQLSQRVGKGTPVSIVHHIYKAGFDHGVLYFEAHHPINHSEPKGPLNHRDPEETVGEVVKHYKQVIAIEKVDWDKVYQIIKSSEGVPRMVFPQNQKHNK